MSDHPPAPDSPASRPTITNLSSHSESNKRIIVTTSQLATATEDALDLSLDPEIFEELLLDLERRGYIEWIDITQNGEYIWDLTESPEKLADAVAAAVMNQIMDWIDQ